MANQVRVMKPDRSYRTYHGCVGVKGERQEDGSIIVTFKQVGGAVPWVEIRLPHDGDVVFVMDGQGKDEMAYRPKLRAIAERS